MKNCAWIFAWALAIGLGFAAQAATYYSAGGDSLNTSSFSGTGECGGWSLTDGGSSKDATSVTYGNDYVISHNLRMPPDGNPYTFPGGTLTLREGGGIALKETADITVTIPTLIVTDATGNGASIANSNPKRTFTLLGTSWTIAAGSTLVIQDANDKNGSDGSDGRHLKLDSATGSAFKFHGSGVFLTRNLEESPTTASNFIDIYADFTDFDGKFVCQGNSKLAVVFKTPESFPAHPSEFTRDAVKLVGYSASQAPRIKGRRSLPAGGLRPRGPAQVLRWQRHHPHENHRSKISL